MLLTHTGFFCLVVAMLDTELCNTSRIVHVINKQCLIFRAHLQALKSGKAPTANQEETAGVVIPVTDEVSINRWKEVQAVTVAPLQQLRKDGPKEEGELDECEKVRVQQAKWHGYITARCIAQLVIM
jgi:hypothetical protein